MVLWLGAVPDRQLVILPQCGRLTLMEPGPTRSAEAAGFRLRVWSHGISSPIKGNLLRQRVWSIRPTWPGMRWTASWVTLLPDRVLARDVSMPCGRKWARPRRWRRRLPMRSEERRVGEERR